MPLFEYRCQDCDQKFTFLYGVVAGNTEPRCPHCQSLNLKKLISRVRHLRGDEAAFASLADPTKLGDLDDPRDLRKWAREMGRGLGAETGEDLSSEFEEMIEEDGRAPREGGEDTTIY